MAINSSSLYRQTLTTLSLTRDKRPCARSLSRRGKGRAFTYSPCMITTTNIINTTTFNVIWTCFFCVLERCIAADVFAVAIFVRKMGILRCKRICIFEQRVLTIISIYCRMVYKWTGELPQLLHDALQLSFIFSEDPEHFHSFHLLSQYP